MTQDQEELERAMPSSVDAEKTILGAILLEPAGIGDVMAKLIPDDFFLDSHQRIIVRMAQLSKREEPIDIVTLANELSKNSEVEAIGGVAYLASLTEGLPRRPEVSSYIQIVKEKSMLRQTMQLCSQAVSLAADPAGEPMELISSLQGRLDEIVAPMAKREASAVKDFGGRILEEIAADYMRKKSPTIPSGNPWFDAKTDGGYRTARYTIVAARPKIGKSSWGITSTAYNCKRGRMVHWFSLEMDKKEIMLNLVPYLTELANVVCVRPNLRSPAQNDVVLEAVEKIANEWPLEIEDGEMTCDQICWSIDRQAREMKKQDQEVLFILDHFGLIAGGDRDIRKRYVEHSERLRKKIKAHQNAALLCLFQLNEVPREYADKRPQRSDIGESKKPLQDCYAAAFLHRYQDKETLRMTTKANVNLELLRGGGAPGNVDGEFDVRRLEFLTEAELEFTDTTRY